MAKSRTFVVDAYNVIRSLLSREELSHGLEAARNILEARLRSFQARSIPAPRILLVYDGDASSQSSTWTSGALEVYFARPPRKADDLILSLCRKLEGAGDVHVVTSDVADIGERIGNLRLEHWTAQEFAELVAGKVRPRKGSGGLAARGEAKPESIHRSEVDRWVDEFGFGKEGRRES